MHLSLNRGVTLKRMEGRFALSSSRLEFSLLWGPEIFSFHSPTTLFFLKNLLEKAFYKKMSLWSQALSDPSWLGCFIPRWVGPRSSFQQVGKSHVLLFPWRICPSAVPEGAAIPFLCDHMLDSWPRLSQFHFFALRHTSVEKPSGACS